MANNTAIYSIDEIYKSKQVFVPAGIGHKAYQRLDPRTKKQEIKVGDVWSGKAFRSESGYEHERNTKVNDVVKYETEELGNDIKVPKELLAKFGELPASKAVWVTRTKKEARYYDEEGSAGAEYVMPPNSVVIGRDDEGGYLVVKGGMDLAKAWKNEHFSIDRADDCIWLSDLRGKKRVTHLTKDQAREVGKELTTIAKARVKGHPSHRGPKQFYVIAHERQTGLASPENYAQNQRALLLSQGWTEVAKGHFKNREDFPGHSITIYGGGAWAHEQPSSRFYGHVTKGSDYDSLVTRLKNITKRIAKVKSLMRNRLDVEEGEGHLASPPKFADYNIRRSMIRDILREKIKNGEMGGDSRSIEAERKKLDKLTMDQLKNVSEGRPAVPELASPGNYVEEGKVLTDDNHKLAVSKGWLDTGSSLNLTTGTHKVYEHPSIGGELHISVGSKGRKWYHKVAGRTVAGSASHGSLDSYLTTKLASPGNYVEGLSQEAEPDITVKRKTVTPGHYNYMVGDVVVGSSEPYSERRFDDPRAMTSSSYYVKMNSFTWSHAGLIKLGIPLNSFSLPFTLNSRVTKRSFKAEEILNGFKLMKRRVEELMVVPQEQRQWIGGMSFL